VLPKHARVVVHDENNHLGLEAQSIVDRFPFEYGISYGLQQTPRDVYVKDLRSGAAVIAFCLISLVVYLFAVWQLNPFVRPLSPIPVAAFVIYPYLKRFTWLCHFWLGAIDGLNANGRCHARESKPESSTIQ